MPHRVVAKFRRGGERIRGACTASLHGMRCGNRKRPALSGKRTLPRNRGAEEPSCRNAGKESVAEWLLLQRNASAQLPFAVSVVFPDGSCFFRFPAERYIPCGFIHRIVLSCVSEDGAAGSRRAAGTLLNGFCGGDLRFRRGNERGVVDRFLIPNHPFHCRNDVKSSVPADRAGHFAPSGIRPRFTEKNKDRRRAQIKESS